MIRTFAHHGKGTYSSSYSNGSMGGEMDRPIEYDNTTKVAIINSGTNQNSEVMYVVRCLTL